VKSNEELKVVGRYASHVIFIRNLLLKLGGGIPNFCNLYDKKIQTALPIPQAEAIFDG
jgi:hypothetical protein